MHSAVERQALQSRSYLQTEVVVVEDVVLGGVGVGSVGKAILCAPRARQTRKHFHIVTPERVTRLSIKLVVSV